MARRRAASGEGLLGDRGPRVRKQLAEQVPVTARRVLAVASNREARLLRHRRQQLYDVAGLRLGHLFSIAASISLPPRVRPGLRQCPRHHVGARRELGKPDVEVITRRKLLLAHAPRWAPNGAQPHALPGRPRCAQPNDPNGHALGRAPGSLTAETRSRLRARQKDRAGCAQRPYEAPGVRPAPAGGPRLRRRTRASDRIAAARGASGRIATRR
jgi:hypothetical protein